jgi:hypothetical protein
MPPCPTAWTRHFRLSGPAVRDKVLADSQSEGTLRVGAASGNQRAWACGQAVTKEQHDTFRNPATKKLSHFSHLSHFAMISSS